MDEAWFHKVLILFVCSGFLLVVSLANNEQYDYDYYLDRLTAITTNESSNGLPDYTSEYSEYIVSFGKNLEYSVLNDEILFSKYYNFVQTHLKILQHEISNESYKLTHNRFSDWSIKERKKLFTNTDQMNNKKSHYNKQSNNGVNNDPCPKYIFEFCTLEIFFFALCFFCFHVTHNLLYFFVSCY